jgi:hypothetical protein
MYENPGTAATIGLMLVGAAVGGAVGWFLHPAATAATTGTPPPATPPFTPPAAAAATSAAGATALAAAITQNNGAACDPGGNTTVSVVPAVSAFQQAWNNEGAVSGIRLRIDGAYDPKTQGTLVGAFASQAPSGGWPAACTSIPPNQSGVGTLPQQLNSQLG